MPPRGPVPRPPMIVQMPMHRGMRPPRTWSSIRKTNPGEFWGIIVFTFFVMVGIGVGLYFLIKMLLGDCGKEGKKPCSSGCNDGLVEDSEGICRSSGNCGGANQSPCQGTGCSTGFVLGSSGVCVTPVCGADGQAPCPPGGDGDESGCLEGFFFEEGEGVCKRLCSTKDQEPCPDEKCDDGLMVGLNGKCQTTAAVLAAYGGIGAATLLVAGGGTALAYYRGRDFLRRFRRVAPSGVMPGGVDVGGESGREFSLDARVANLLSQGFLRKSSTPEQRQTFANLDGLLSMVKSDPKWGIDEKQEIIGKLESLAESMLADKSLNPSEADIATALGITEPEVQEGTRFGQGLIELDAAPPTLRTTPKFEAWYDATYPGASPIQRAMTISLFKRFREVADTKLTAEEQKELDDAKEFTDREFRGEGMPTLMGLPKALADRPSFGSASVPAERLILHGDPGTGKTMWVRRLATSNPKLVVFSFDASKKSPIPGEAEENLRRMFLAVRKLRAQGKDAIIMLDEVDGVFDPSSPGGTALSTSIQQRMSDFRDVPVVMMTNHPERLPAAIESRSTSVEVKLPDMATRARILLDKIAKVSRTLSEDRRILDAEATARRLSKIKFSGRDAENAFQRVEEMVRRGVEFSEEMIKEALTEASKKPDERKSRTGLRKRLGRAIAGE